MRKGRYNQLDSLTSSRDTEISRLSIIVKSLEVRMESIKESHNDLLHKINALYAKSHAAQPKSGRLSRYTCDMCGSKFNDSKHLQQHRKNAHKAPYNI